MSVVKAPVRPVRIITKSAFFLRFKPEERAGIRNSVIPEVVDDYEFMKLADSVELDNQLTIDCLGNLLTNNLLADQARVDALRADGSQEEKY